MDGIKVGDNVVVRIDGPHKGMTGKVQKIWGYTATVELILDAQPDSYRLEKEFFLTDLDKIEDEMVQENFVTPKLYDLKDSGERTEFSTGAVRDMSKGKGLFRAMPWSALLRLSKHYENGARKYGEGNYTKGIPASSFADSALRHMAKYLAGWDDEDHLSAAAWNILGLMEMEENHPDMCDIPMREGKNKFRYSVTENEKSKSE